MAQKTKFNPVIISSSKSEIINKAYKKVIKPHKVQMIYE